MPLSDALLAIRALNYWRSLYTPTYVGLRAIADTNAVHRSQGGWLRATVEHKALVRGKGRYVQFAWLKGHDRHNQPATRQMWAASPSTALQEAWALELLARDAGERGSAFATHPCAYSYLWPRGSGSRSYSYFYGGFMNRYREVRERLRSSDENVAIVADIANFYPSINKTRVQAKLAECLSASRLSAPDKVAVAKCFTRYLDCTGPAGIAVGPALSHVLGHLALAEFDKAVANKWGHERYLRYVDDMVIVAKRSEAQQIEGDLRDILADHGFFMAEGKGGAVSREGWDAFAPRLEGAGKVHGFGWLLTRLRLYLGLFPSRLPELESALSSVGVHLPLRKLQAVGRYGRFGRYIKSLRGVRGRSMKRNWALFSSLVAARLATPDSLSRDAIAVRDELKRELDAVEAREAADPLLQRWRVQRMRNLCIRLLFLQPRTEYASLLAKLGSGRDVLDLRAVVDAVMRADASAVLSLPGPPTIAMCELWRVHGLSAVPISEEVLRDDARVDSAITMAFWGVGRLPSDIVPTISEKALIAAAGSGLGNVERSVTDLSYGDEIESLLGSTEMIAIADTFTTRFDDMEAWRLDALDLAWHWS